MSRAPQFNNGVADSLEAVLADYIPMEYLGTDKEAGIKFITALVKHYRSPENIAKRAAIVDYGRRYRNEKA